MVCSLSVIILKVTGNGPLQGKETLVAPLQNAVLRTDVIEVNKI